MFPIRTFIRTYATNTKPCEIIKFYYDFKSPYTYLAFEPALKLEKDYPIKLHFIPWPFHPDESFGGNLQERSQLNWNKIRYLYLDCGRFANERGMVIRGPEHLYNSRLSSIGGLYADKNNFFVPYARQTFQRFFNRQLDLEDFDEITKILYEASKKIVSLEQYSHDFQDYLNNEGEKDYSNAQDEADQNKIFGVPTFVVRGEPFWGTDTISWVKKKLESLKLQ